MREVQATIQKRGKTSIRTMEFYLSRKGKKVFGKIKPGDLLISKINGMQFGGREIKNMLCELGLKVKIVVKYNHYNQKFRARIK